MMKMKINIVTAAVLAAIAFSSCGSQKTQEVQQDRQEIVETTVLKKSDIRRVLEFSSTLEGYETVNISPSITGKIDHILVEVGTNVKEGTLLVEMDRNQYNTTKLAFIDLGVDLARLEALKETGAVSQQTFDKSKLSYDQTKENLAFLEANTFIKAPFSGVISKKNYEDGELYSGQPILVLTKIQNLKCYISVPESYFPLVKPGMNINFTSDIYPGEVFPSYIEIIHPTVDESTHTFQLKLRVPNGNLKLRPGMYVRTKLELGHTEAFMVPYAAVLKMTGANDRYIFVNENGVAKRIFVKTGQRIDDLIEIESDEIFEGAKLVTLGQSKLVEGSKLNVTKENQE